MKQLRNEIPQKYEAPAIEIYKVEVEKGFAATGPMPSSSPNDPTDGGTSSDGVWPGGAWG